MYVYGSCVCMCMALVGCVYACVKPDFSASEHQGSASSLCPCPPRHPHPGYRCVPPCLAFQFLGTQQALHQMSHLPSLVFVWDRVSPFGPKLAICPVSASHLLGLQACTTTSFLYQGFVKFFAKRGKQSYKRNWQIRNKDVEASINSSYLFAHTPNKNRIIYTFWKIYKMCMVYNYLQLNCVFHQFST